MCCVLLGLATFEAASAAIGKPTSSPDIGCKHLTGGGLGDGFIVWENRRVIGKIKASRFGGHKYIHFGRYRFLLLRHGQVTVD